MNNYSPDKWIDKAKELALKSVKARESLTKEELEDLRLNITLVRTFLALETLTNASENRIVAELALEGIEGKEFTNYFKAYSGREYVDAKGDKKYYTASIAESLARKAMKTEGVNYHNKMKALLEAKQYESMVYQLLKSLDQISNALSAVSKN